MKIKTKKCKKWRYAYRKFSIKQRFNIEGTSKERSQIRIMEVKKSYILRDIMTAVTFYFWNPEPTPCFYRFLLFLLPFIVDLTFDKILNI